MLLLSEHFSTKEFSCGCGCGFGANTGDVNPTLLELLENIRGELNYPLNITSGCRCVEHNRAIGGSRNSAHLRGKAADIYCISSSIRYKIVKAALKYGAKRIEIGGHWVHLDVDMSLSNPILWLAPN